MRDLTLSDDTLVAGMGAGDESAGVTFVRRYESRVDGARPQNGRRARCSPRTLPGKRSYGCGATRSRSTAVGPRSACGSSRSPAVGCSSCVLWL